MNTERIKELTDSLLQKETQEAAEAYAAEILGEDHLDCKGVTGSISEDFIAGVEWERNRNKWISVKDADDLPPPGKYFTITDLSMGQIQLIDFPNRRFTDEFNREWWLRHVKLYQYFPELPKQ